MTVPLMEVNGLLTIMARQLALHCNPAIHYTLYCSVQATAINDSNSVRSHVGVL